MLKSGESLPITYESFIAECKEKCSKRHYAIIASASLNGQKKTKNKFLHSFEHFKVMVAKELASFRAQRLKLDDVRYQYLGDKESRITETVRKAVFSDNPLDGEKLVLSLYWSYLDDVANGHQFDLDALLVYALRLQILQRLSLFGQDKGNEEFNRLFGTLKKEIFQK